MNREDENQNQTKKTSAIDAISLSMLEFSALEESRTRHALRLFTNIEKALSIDKLKSTRLGAREFMAIRDQVLVLPTEKDEMDESGILFIPATAQERPSEGIVVAVGRGHVDANNVFVPTEVQPGDRVLFGKYAGKEIKLQGRTCRLIREEEIDGVIR